MRDSLELLNNQRYKTFKISTLGCKVNQTESEILASLLSKKGLNMSEKPELVIVNTCAVTSEAEAKSRKRVRKLARKYNPKRIMILGCASELIAGDIKNTVEEDTVFLPQSRKKDLIKNLENTIGERALGYTGRRSRAFLKVQDGCNRRCSYCIVPLLRGNEVSISDAEIVERAKRINAKGVNELVLTGIHLGRFRYGEVDLPALIRKILDNTSARIRLSSIDVEDVTERLIEMVKDEQRVCSHFHIPLQSGSKKILNEMGRPYTPESYLNTIYLIKSKIKPVALSTDVMVGFPGESNKDYKNTLRVIKEAGFMRLHVFRFSPRPGTKAYQRKDRVEHEKVKKREKRLLKLGRKLEVKFKENLSGEEMQLLIEKHKNEFSIGRSDYYLKAMVRDRLETGSLVNVKVRYDKENLIGEVL